MLRSETLKLRSTNISETSSRYFCFGLVNRKERWGLSWEGWLLVVAAAVVIFGVSLLRVYPFLAVTQRVSTQVLVVEGWMHHYAIRAAVQEFHSGGYKEIISTGGPVAGSGRYVNDYQTSASVGAELLKQNGLPGEVVHMVPSRVMDHDRTYASAVALRNWFHERNLPVPSVNVVTEDLHARRTRLLFQKALGREVAVGIIAVPNPDYDATRWWRYSEGVKGVVTETASYFYARVLFYPGD